MKVLVIQTAFLGDAVISLSLAEELRRFSPDAYIAYLVRPEVAPIIYLSPSVDKVFAYDKYDKESGLAGINNKAAELNQEGFDTIITLHDSKRTRLLIEKLDAKIKIGCGNSDALTHKVSMISGESQTSNAIRLLQVLFPKADLKALPKLVASELVLTEEIKRLPRPIIAIASDSVWKTKQWGNDKFIELIDFLITKGYSIVLIGRKKDFDISNSYINILDLRSKTSLEALTAIISHCDVLISNDSASVHISTATGTRSIVIYGPTIPEFGFAPAVDLGIVVQNEGLWCRPCASHGSNECPIHTHECMTSISPQHVFDITERSLSLRSGAFSNP